MTPVEAQLTDIRSELVKLRHDVRQLVYMAVVILGFVYLVFLGLVLKS